MTKTIFSKSDLNNLHLCAQIFPDIKNIPILVFPKDLTKFIPKMTKEICLNLLDGQLKTTISLWSQVPIEFVPKIMQDEITKMKRLVNG